MRSELLNAGFSRILPDHVPNDLSLNPLPQTVPARVTRLKILPLEISAACSQSSMRLPNPVPESYKREKLCRSSRQCPVILPLLQIRDAEFNSFVPT